MPGADLIKQCETQTWICKIQEKKRGRFPREGNSTKNPTTSRQQPDKSYVLCLFWLSLRPALIPGITLALENSKRCPSLAGGRGYRGIK